MLTTTIFHVLISTTILPAGMPQEGGSAAVAAKAAPEGLAVGKNAEGILVLGNGERLQGMVYKTRKGWALKKDGKRTRFADADVQRFVSQEALLEKFEQLAAKTDPKQLFAQAQLCQWAFENGLTDKAWPILGELYASNKQVPGLDKVEALAAESYLREFTTRQKLDTKARRMLLEANDVKGHPVRQAKNEITPLALGQLLRLERKAMQEESKTPTRQANTKKKKSLKDYAKGQKAIERGKVEQLLREYAEEALSTHRRLLARRALLEDSKSNQAFVYRLAVRFPLGPNRRDILDEVFAKNLVDDAATYLSKQLRYDGPVLIKARTAEVLGDLGSPIALPALRATKKALDSGALKKKGGGGGGSRAYIAVTTQTSYIRDFSVEVASAAAIANPEVDVIESGTVLDARVLGVDWTRYITYLGGRLDRAIEKITSKAAKE